MGAALELLKAQRRTGGREAEERLARQKGLERAEAEKRLEESLRAEEEPAIARLKDFVTLLGLIAPLLLCGVDSFTRDDLLTLTALKVGAQTLRFPDLILEATVSSGLVRYFQALHVTPALLRDIGKEAIRRSEASGEWLIVNYEYSKYLQSKDRRKQAEPLDGIVKQRTLKLMDLPQLEAALESLAILLGTADANATKQPGARREAFFRSLLEMANACTLSSLDQPMDAAFLSGLQPEKLSPRLQALKKEQQRLLEELQRRSTSSQVLEGNFGAFEEKLTATFKRLLFERLRLLCSYRLQLVSISAYNALGDAAQLSVLLASPEFTLENVQLFRLLSLHQLLNSLGYGLAGLRRVVALLTSTSTDLLLPGFDVKQAESLFFEVKRELSELGRTADTAPMLERLATKERLTGPARTLARRAASFAGHFPSIGARQRDEGLGSFCGSTGAYDTLATELMQEVGRDGSQESSALAREICSVFGFFEGAPKPLAPPARVGGGASSRSSRSSSGSASSSKTSRSPQKVKGVRAIFKGKL